MQGFPIKQWRKRLLKVLLYLFASLLLLQAVFVILVAAGAFGKLPDQNSLRQIQNPTATEVYSADGVLMGSYYIENRQYLDPSEIPEMVRSAFSTPQDIVTNRNTGKAIESRKNGFTATTIFTTFIV